MRILNRLSSRFVATATEPGRYADGGNLYFSISPNGGRRFVFLYRWRGKPIEMGLGSVRSVSLAQARIKAAEARTALADGKNPKEIRRDAQAIPTFGEAADDFVAAMEDGWKNDKHRAQWKMTLKKYAAPLRSLSVADIDTDDVLGVLQPIWNAKPETASRLRGRIERILDAARAKGHRKGDNPARWRGHLETLLSERKRLTRGHHAAMDYKDIPQFMQRLRSAPPSISNLALEFTILTVARTAETIGATDIEFDRDTKLWTVPAARMKAGKEHVVPLCARAIEILKIAAALHTSADAFMFPGQKAKCSLSNMAMTAALNRLGIEDCTVHGFRSTFRDWAGDCTDHAREVIEAALAHQLSDKSEAAYRRRTAVAKRRVLMDDWASFLDSAGKVVPLAAVREAS